MSPIGPTMPVLVDEDVWPEFADAILKVGEEWTAPSGRVYALALSGRRLQIDYVPGGNLRAGVPDDLPAAPSGDAIDADLFELACAVLDAVEGDEWAGDRLRMVAGAWGAIIPGVKTLPFQPQQS